MAAHSRTHFMLYEQTLSPSLRSTSDHDRAPVKARRSASGSGFIHGPPLGGVEKEWQHLPYTIGGQMRHIQLQADCVTAQSHEGITFRAQSESPGNC